MKTKFILFVALFLLTPLTSKAAVVINEIAWMGTTDSANDEWIELYNNGTEIVDLTGWILEAADGSPVIHLTKTIPANGYFLLERTDDTSVPNISADQIYTGALVDTGESLILRDAGSNPIDQVDCSNEWIAGNKDTKQTMERTTAGWQTSLNPGGTPGTQNSSGAIEEPESTTEKPATFIPAENQPPIANAGDNIIAFIDDEITFDGSKSYDPDGNDLAYEWNLGEGGVKNDVIVTHKYFYPGTYLVTLMVFDGRYYTSDTITVEIYTKKIVINEFLPNPTGKDEEEEWIELYNDSDQIVDISGWQLDDEDGGSKPFIFPKNTLIAPKSYLVFPRQTTKIALNNDKDKVRLLLLSGMVFQEITYEKPPQGKSSARTPKGFIWSIPTPGLPNIIGVETQELDYERPLQSETAKQSSGNVALKYDSKNSIEGGWVELSKDQEQNPENKNFYNLANIEKSTDSSKLILIIVTIIIVFAAGIGFLKLRRKI